MKTIKELLFAAVIGAALGVMLIYSLDAEMELREQQMGVRHGRR